MPSARNIAAEPELRCISTTDIEVRTRTDNDPAHLRIFGHDVRLNQNTGIANFIRANSFSLAQLAEILARL